MSSQVFSLIKQLTSEVQMLHEKIGSMMQTNITLIQKHSDLEERIVVLEKSEKSQVEIIEGLKSKLKMKSASASPVPKAKTPENIDAQDLIDQLIKSQKSSEKLKIVDDEEKNPPTKRQKLTPKQLPKFVFARGSEAAAKAPHCFDEDDYLRFKRDLLDHTVSKKICAHIDNCDEDCSLKHVKKYHNDDNLWAACRLSKKTAHSSVIYRILRYLKKEEIEDHIVFDHIHGHISVRGMPMSSQDRMKELAFATTKCYCKALSMPEDYENLLCSYVLIAIKQTANQRIHRAGKNWNSIDNKQSETTQKFLRTTNLDDLAVKDMPESTPEMLLEFLRNKMNEDEKETEKVEPKLENTNLPSLEIEDDVGIAGFMN